MGYKPLPDTLPSGQIDMGWRPLPVILPNGSHIGSATSSLGALEEFQKWAHRCFRWRYVDGRSEADVREATYREARDVLEIPRNKLLAFGRHAIRTAGGEDIMAWQIEARDVAKPWQPGEA